MNVSQLTKHFGARTVLDGVGFRLDPGERLAVVGRNGEGKTTLLRILAGQLAPDGGQVSMPKGSHVALHDQRPPLATGLTLEQYVAEGLTEAQEAERELAELEARMAGGDAGEEVFAAYERATARLERAGGYAWRSWMERVLRGLGIQEDALSRPLDSFSGGELTRASLARALVGRPDVLLLDEPTNHLDLEAVEWLEGALREVGAAVVLVSHDRWFLESVATRVLDIEGGRAKLWPLRYSEYRREKALAIDRQGALAERQAQEIARLERFVTRWKAGTKSRQAASRQKQLDRMTPVAAPPPRRRAASFGFPKAERSARLVIEADRLTVEVPGRTLVRDAGFAIERGQRVALVAPNGAGKTTLLETLLGERPPAAGRISLGHKVQPSYFSQHGEELRDDRTIIESTLEIGTMTNTQARTLLGNLLFPGEIVDRKVERLSGGERRRLGLVRLIAQGGNLLVLDEPTNHLDTESREALEDALEAYEGTVLMVSHDRALIDLVATHTLAIEDGTLRMRSGGYSDLLAARAAEAAAPPAPAPARRPAKAATARTPKGGRAPEREGAPRRSKDRVRQLEGEIAALEARIAAVEDGLAQAATAADHEAIAQRGEEHRTLQGELAWLMREWETAAEAAGVA